MKTTASAFVLAVAAALAALSACAGGGGSTKKSEPAKAQDFEVADPVKLALQPVSVPPELKSFSSAPENFETVLCNRLFKLNKGQIMCADAVKAFIETKRMTLVMGSDEDSSMEALLKNLDAPRRISLVGSRAGDGVLLTVIVHDGNGNTLDRFEVKLQQDGGDVFERADEAALRIVQLPAPAKP